MKKLKRLVKVSGRSGFTLVELLIVVIILAVLAAIVVPQFSSSTNEAKEAALRSTLLEMRNAVELYYHQHNGTYPGHNDNSGGSPATPSTVDTVDDAFLEQLTRYTDINGKTSNVRDLTVTPQIKYGPYLKRDTLPTNPIDDSAAVTFILAGNTDAGKLDHPLAEPAAGSSGWWFDVISGKFVANTPGKGIDGTLFYKW